MLFIGLGIALIIMDATIVIVILPSIIADLKISSLDAEWINAIYSLTFAALLIVMGRLGDRYGRRKIFVLGAAFFGLSSLLAASAATGAFLIFARAMQGVGGAMMSPTSLSMVNALYRGKSRAIAFAIYGSVIGGMAAVGPLAGGWLTQTYSWHWSFWINVPISILIVFGCLKYVPESKAEGDVGSADYVGAVLSTVGVAALIFALIEGRNYGWWYSTSDHQFIGREWLAGAISPVALALVISAFTLTALYFYESRLTRNNKYPLIDFDLFKIKTFGLGSFAGLIISLGEFGLLFSLPLFLQSVLGWSALGAGGLLVMLAVGSFMAAPTAAQLANKRNPRFVLRLGLILEILGVVGIAATVQPSTSGWIIGGWLLIYGMGVGYATAQLTGLILSDIPIEKSGQASGAQGTARQIGAAMGTAVLGTIVFVSLYNRTEANITSADTAYPAAYVQGIAKSVEASAGTVIPSLGVSEGPVIQDAAERAFADSVRLTGFAAAGFLLLGLLSSLALPPGDAHSREGEDTNELIHDFE